MELSDLIAQGEGVSLDFKLEITSYSKIARTVVAFANTQGGRLLVGVKDNGKVKGCNFDEERHMLDGAARDFCVPEVSISYSEIKYEGRSVLIGSIKAGEEKPYRCKDEEGKLSAYVRVKDECIKASPVVYNVLKRAKQTQGTVLAYTEIEKLLFKYLEQNEVITFSKFRKLTKLVPWKVNKVLVNLILLKIIQVEYADGKEVYVLKK